MHQRPAFFRGRGRGRLPPEGVRARGRRRQEPRLVGDGRRRDRPRRGSARHRRQDRHRLLRIQARPARLLFRRTVRDCSSTRYPHDSRERRRHQHHQPPLQVGGYRDDRHATERRRPRRVRPLRGRRRRLRRSRAHVRPRHIYRQANRLQLRRRDKHQRGRRRRHGSAKDDPRFVRRNRDVPLRHAGNGLQDNLRGCHCRHCRPDRDGRTGRL